MLAEPIDRLPRWFHQHRDIDDELTFSVYTRIIEIRLKGYTSGVAYI